jgi:hypothetical protein
MTPSEIEPTTFRFVTVVPQPTAPPRAAKFEEGLEKKNIPDTHEVGEWMDNSDCYNFIK